MADIDIYAIKLFWKIMHLFSLHVLYAPRLLDLYFR